MVVLTITLLSQATYRNTQFDFDPLTNEEIDSIVSHYYYPLTHKYTDSEY